jgi:hypothetical protein
MNASNELRSRANTAMEQGREIYQRSKEELSSYARQKGGELS